MNFSGIPLRENDEKVSQNVLLQTLLDIEMRPCGCFNLNQEQNVLVSRKSMPRNELRSLAIHILDTFQGNVLCITAPLIQVRTLRFIFRDSLVSKNVWG